MTTVSKSPPPPPSALEEAEFVRNSLIQWQPQKFIWLGIKINLIHSRFTIPVDRILSITKSTLFIITNLPYNTASNLSKLCGKIISSTKFELGNIAQLKSRNLHKIIQAELTWDRRTRLHENDKVNQKIIF